MRYFVELAYLGTRYAGWQKQPFAPTVQGHLEEALQTILRTQTSVVGCGRTDAGVHARQYYCHFDTDTDIRPPEHIYKLNAVLPGDIAISGIRQVSEVDHARFSAIQRTYQYYVVLHKDPFKMDTAWRYPYAEPPDWALMNEAGALLKQYTEFEPFCKSGSDTPHFLCNLSGAMWRVNDHEAVFTISANRFLRGMVRLIVGALVQVGRGQLSIEELRDVMKAQRQLPRPLSAPAHGLHLAHIEY